MSIFDAHWTLEFEINNVGTGRSVRLYTHKRHDVNERTHGKKGKRKVQGVPQSQTAALPRHQEEEETDKTKQAQIEQTHEKY